MGQRITLTDIRRTGHCVRGIRRWFEGRNLDFRAFMASGIDEDELLATGDALAEQVVAAVQQRRLADG